MRGALEGARVLPLDTPSGARLGIARNSGGPRAHTSLDRARLPERGCRTIGAWQPLLGCAEAKRLPRAPLSGNQQPRWQPAASAWLPASRCLEGWLPAREPRSPAWQPKGKSRRGSYETMVDEGGRRIGERSGTKGNLLIRSSAKLHFFSPRGINCESPGKSPEERLVEAMVEAGVDPTAETRSVVRSLWLPEDASRHP